MGIEPREKEIPMTRRAQRSIRKLLNWRTAVGIGVALVLVLGIGQLFHAWDPLWRNLAGSAFPGPPGGYTCMPSCDETDGRFLSHPGEMMDSFAGARIVLWIAVPEQNPSFELGFFDGDSGKDNTGAVNVWEGNWDDTEVETTYTLYADPSKNGRGTTVVQQWLGNQDAMPNNAWFDVTVDNVPEAKNLNGHYFYRLECTRPALGYGINAFKVRSTGYLSTGQSNLVDASFAIVGMVATQHDIPIVYPEFAGDYENLGPSTYNGEWSFSLNIPYEEATLEFWDGDFDRGTSGETAADSDDPNTEGKPSWASADAVAERAGGGGSPADDAQYTVYRREPPVQYQIIDPAGDPVYTNDEPSGTEEWEKFVVSTDPEVAADLSADSILPGLYTWRVIGLDIHNTVWIRTDYEICPPEGCGPPVCPPCPECEPCECEEPTPEPEPTVEPTATPLPTPEPCPDPDPVDLLYLLDISGSMDQPYPGPGTKLDAAKQAIHTLDNWVAQQGNGSRVALITFHGAGQGQGHPPYYSTDVQVVAEFTADIAGFDAIVDGLDAWGSTPTAEALNLVTSWLPGAWDASHVPLVILISDGVPTVDLDHHAFQDEYVQQISLYGDDGNFLDPETVRGMGAYFGSYGENAGETLADTMLSIQNLMATIPEARVYSIAVQAEAGGIFNDDILKYVAAKGNGQFFMANDADSLAEALQWAFVDSSCGEGPPPPPPPPPPPLDCTPYKVVQREKYYGKSIKIRIRNDSGEAREINAIHIDNWPNPWGNLFQVRILGEWFTVNSAAPADIDIHRTLPANTAGNQFFKFTYTFGADDPAFTGYFELDNGCHIDF